MPGYNRAALSVELTVVASATGEQSPQAQIEAAKHAAAETGLAHEAGPETTLLSGGRTEVLDALRAVLEASLDAGVQRVTLTLEAEGDASRFTET